MEGGEGVIGERFTPNVPRFPLPTLCLPLLENSWVYYLSFSSNFRTLGREDHRSVGLCNFPLQGSLPCFFLS